MPDALFFAYVWRLCASFLLLFWTTSSADIILQFDGRAAMLARWLLRCTLLPIRAVLILAWCADRHCRSPRKVWFASYRVLPGRGLLSAAVLTVRHTRSKPAIHRLYAHFPTSALRRLSQRHDGTAVAGIIRRGSISYWRAFNGCATIQHTGVSRLAWCSVPARQRCDTGNKTSCAPVATPLRCDLLNYATRSSSFWRLPHSSHQHSDLSPFLRERKCHSHGFDIFSVAYRYSVCRRTQRVANCHRH